MSDETLPEQIAVFMHETYERLAPSFGYETRSDTKKFNPLSPNGRLMIAVCAETYTVATGINNALRAALQSAKEDAERAKAETQEYANRLLEWSEKPGFATTAQLESIQSYCAQLEKENEALAAAHARAEKLERELAEVKKGELLFWDDNDAESCYFDPQEAFEDCLLAPDEHVTVCLRVARSLPKEWYVAFGCKEDEDERKILGPFATKDEALAARTSALQTGGKEGGK